MKTDEQIKQYSSEGNQPMKDVPAMTTSFPAACDAIDWASSKHLKVVTFSRSYPGTDDGVLGLNIQEINNDCTNNEVTF